MASKAAIIKFGPQSKSQIKGKVHHTRTGACTCKATEKCYHGKIKHSKTSGKVSKSKSKIGK